MQTHQPTFYWHDYETWGLNPTTDRPAQFAGIRTDLDFNILERDMFYCRLSDDYLPDPHSVLVTKITPEKTQDEGLVEAEFAKKINQQFIQPDTCVVGYNSIRFDEEFSRHLFYRNFYDPYEHTWKNDNSRWDIIDLARATYALRPEGIKWPKDEQDLPRFKLELLTEANEISHEHAHDALSDVFATIAIAKLIKEKSPKLFNYYFQLRDKNKVKALIDTVTMNPLVHVSGMFGAKRGNISLVAPVTWHPVNKNAVVVVDLAQDISPLFELSADDIRERLYTKWDDLGEKLPIPLKLIHINKSPFIANIKTLLAENRERLDIDYQACLENLAYLKANKPVANVIEEVFNQRNQFDHNGNVDAMLYDGFFSYADKRLFEKIRSTKPENLSQLNLAVSDKRFNDLFFNYKARNFPHVLTKDEQQRRAQHRQLALEPKLSDYFDNLNQLKQGCHDEKDITLLKSLQQYAEKLLESLRE